MSVDPSQVSVLDDLKLGFVDPVVVGVVEAVRLTIIEQQLIVFDQTFVGVGAILAFFDDRVLDLPSPAPGFVGRLGLDVTLEVTTSRAGEAFRTGFVLAFVPKPSLGLLLLGVAFAVGRRGRRGGASGGERAGDARPAVG